MTKVLARIFLAIALFASTPSASWAAQLTLFPTQQQAQQHCPSDIVVWLNLPSGIYHFQGQRWYGNTKSGAYVCEKEADAAGDRPTMNGQ